MAILLSATDIHLTSPVTNFPNRILPMSLSCWVNSPSWGVETASMVGVYLPGTTGIQLGAKAGSTGIEVWNWGGGTNISTNGIYAPALNTWINITYTWDGTTHTIYVDGTLITTSTDTSAVVAGVLTMIYINGYPTGLSNEATDTSVDDVSYYNRALSAAEASTIASSRGFKDGIFTGLIARYCFNELPPGSNLITVADYSGNNNMLTPEGTGTTPVYIAGVIDLDERPVLG